MNDELDNRTKSLSDEELLNMIDGNPEDFTEEALDAARKEVLNRGGAELLYQKIEEEMEEVKLLENEDIPPKEFEGDNQHELNTGLFSNVRTLKDETIGDVKQRMIPQASGHVEEVINDIQKLLEASNMPINCRWGVVEVKTKQLFSRVRRDCLIVETDEFPDHHAYISVRDFGIYLDSIIIFTVEPGVFKKFLSKKLTGSEDGEALSRPRNILKLQDFNAWSLVVSACFDQAIDSLIEELDKKPSQILNRERTFLDIG